MTHSSSRTTLLLAALLIASTALIAGRALAPSRPAIVGVVDLESVVNDSYLWANRKAELDKLESELNSKIGEAKQAVTTLDDEMKNFQQNSPAWVQKQSEIFQAIGNYNAMRQFAELKMESGRAEALRETYVEIQEMAKAYAVANAIDLVLVDDSIPAMRKTDTQRTMQNISSRRVLYATQEFNITAELLAQINGKHPLNPGVKIASP